MSNLSWPDIFSQDLDLDFERLLSLWPHSISGQIRPVGMSAFGDIFFERPTGDVGRLDVLEGGVQVVAKNVATFTKLMNSPPWQEEYLLSQVVALLTERGLRRAPTQWFAVIPHPIWCGRIDFDRCMVMDDYPWHVICSQFLDSSSSGEKPDS